VYEVQEAAAAVMLKMLRCYHMMSCHQPHLDFEREKTSMSVAPVRAYGVVTEVRPTEARPTGRQARQAGSAGSVMWRRVTCPRVESAWDTDRGRGSASQARCAWQPAILPYQDWHRNQKPPRDRRNQFQDPSRDLF
jgi:hypothetical protein